LPVLREGIAEEVVVLRRIIASCRMRITKISAANGSKLKT
jgi:hypothetical protein